MKKIILFFNIVLITLNGISQSKINFTDNVGTIDIKEISSYNKGNTIVYKQFVVPIESDGVSINNGVSLTISGLSNSNSYFIRLEAINTPAVYFVDTPLTVNAGTATFNLTFNGTDMSTVYQIIIWNDSTNSKVNFYVNITGGQSNAPLEYYIVTERSKTGQFDNTDTKYKINWVDYWLDKHNAPLFNGTPIQYIDYAEKALKFSWDKQINDWGLCNEVINNQPLLKNTI